MIFPIVDPYLKSFNYGKKTPASFLGRTKFVVFLGWFIIYTQSIKIHSDIILRYQDDIQIPFWEI